MAEFHYVPTGTGVISGREVLRQTEDAINDALEDGGDTREIAERALANSETALQQSGQAVETSNTALATAEQAQTSAASAVSTANQANATSQTALSTAQQASTTSTNAVTAAQAAQTAAENAASDAADSEDIAAQALTSAQAAQTAAEAAQTAAETAQTDADQSATLATQAQTAAAQSAQAASAAQIAAETLANPYRYSAKTTSLTLSAGQTISITDLDNVNVEVGNKIIDAVGNIFSIASIDTANNQVTLASGDPSATPPELGYWENPSVRVVSQSFVIDSSGYVNGYIRYSNGVQICVLRGLSNASDTTLTFPVPFSSAPSVVASANDTSAPRFATAVVNETYITLRIFRSSTDSQEASTYSVIAIGLRS